MVIAAVGVGSLSQREMNGAVPENQPALLPPQRDISFLQTVD